jgi:phage terminase large subunit-like protein
MNNRNANISPVTFIDKLIKLNEKGLPWELSPYQRRVLELAFRRGVNGALAYRVITLSERKKSGKTFIAACLGLWWACITRSTEIIVCANDRAVSVETPRGIRLAKEKQSAKIDGAVALSFAVLCAVQYGKPPPLTDAPSGTVKQDPGLDPRAPYSSS